MAASDKKAEPLGIFTPKNVANGCVDNDEEKNPPIMTY